MLTKPGPDRDGTIGSSPVGLRSALNLAKRPARHFAGLDLDRREAGANTEAGADTTAGARATPGAATTIGAGRPESIAVIVPIYLRPKRAADIASAMLADPYHMKTLVLVVDGDTNEEIEAALIPFRGRAEIRYNGQRLGKTESLMRACSGRREDIFLFLDNDVALPEDGDFLSRLAGLMEDGDLSDLPKEAIGEGLLSRLAGYEFLTTAIAEQVLAVVAGRCPAVMGAALAVRRELFERVGGFRKVLCEDTDFGARAFRHHARFVFDRRLKVATEAPARFVDWINQRRRWALGNLEWLKEYFLIVLHHAFKSPSFLLSAILLFLPALIFPAIFLAMKSLRLSVLLPLVYMLAGRFDMTAGLFLWMAHLRLAFVEGALSTFAGFLASATIYFGCSKIFRFRFGILDYFIFYFVYSPLWVVSNLVVWLLAALGLDPKPDWKT